MHEHILDYLTHIDLPHLLRERLDCPSLRFTRAVEEFSLLPSLGPGVVLLLLSALIPMRRLRPAAPLSQSVEPEYGAASGKPSATLSDADASGDLSRTMTLLWLCCGLNLVLLAVAQGAQPVVHQLPYGLVEGIILGLVTSRHRWKVALPIAAGLQFVNGALIWFGGSWAFWHERL